MDYELGLRTLAARLSADAGDQFRVLEARLRENLSNEALYGATETTRADRARIVGELNRLAASRTGQDFNSMCEAAPARGGGLAGPPAGTGTGTGLAPVQLAKLLDDRFSKGELQGLCFDLGVDWDELSGDTKGAKARELIGYLQRRGRLDELVPAIRRARSDIVI